NTASRRVSTSVSLAPRDPRGGRLRSNCARTRACPRSPPVNHGGLRSGSRFRRAAPVFLVELGRATFRDREGFPVVAGMNPGDLNDLPDVVAGVTQRALERQRDRMRLPPDDDGLLEVLRLEVQQRGGKADPALFPVFDDFGPASERIDELVV